MRRNQINEDISSDLSDTINPTNQTPNQVSGKQISQSNTISQANSQNNVASQPKPAGYNLPSGSITPRDNVEFSRGIIKWYVPEVGIINMYVNPQSIQYANKKIITRERTKGGYSLQYLGEELSTIAVSGHTGSSGIEGINVLYEIYRAEQYTFDPVGLTMASNMSMGNLNELATQVIGGANAIQSSVSSLTNGALGLNPVSQNILPKAPLTLAQSAFTVEMYYLGWAYRGYFEDFRFTEQAGNFLIEYNFNFVITQRRGYRLNNLGHQRVANYGPSNSDIIPLSINSVKR